MKTRTGKIVSMLILLATFFYFTGSVHAQDYKKPDELVAKGTAVFKSFMNDSNMSWFQKNVTRARGIFIVPQMLRGGFIIGGSGGSGLLLAQDYNTGEWSYPAFYTMG